MTFSHPTTLHDVGIICSLGQGKTEVSRSLFEENADNATTQTTLISGRTVPIKDVSRDLPHIKTPQFDTRTNRLLRIALDEIHPAINDMKERFGPHRIGIILATNTSGMEEGSLTYLHHKEHGSWSEDYHYEQQEVASPSAFAAHYLDLKGPAYTVSTACSAGNKALIAAHRLIHAGLCDAVVTGGVDSLCQLTLNGFDALQLISDEITNPFSKNRKGITLGEGAAVILISREEGDIQLLGYGESSDAYHMSAPHPTGEGATTAISEALKRASLLPEHINYINLHGTGTKLNDAAESHSIQNIFGEGSSPLASSTKPLTGHTLGASGAIETAFLWLALMNEQEGSIPLPVHLFDGMVDPNLPKVNLVQESMRAFPSNGLYALMNNAFAFGGSNASVIIGKKSHE